MKLVYGKNLLTTEEMETTAATVADYTDHLRNILASADLKQPEASVVLPGHAETLESVEKLVKEVSSPRLTYIVDIGIGGSNLGTKAVYDALYGYVDQYSPDRFPKMLFADTCNPHGLHSLATFLKKTITHADEILINIISKSGGTTETVANAEIILHALSGMENINKRVVVTTDKDSKLWHAAELAGYARLAIPSLVGGRYSVFSAVGLFPLAAAGVDIRSLLDGARAMREVCVTGDGMSPALASATTLFLHLTKGRSINDNFMFDAQLESLGKWYRQLMGESIGKEEDIRGVQIFAGMTPTVSVGSTDLHSVAQLYLGGPRDKVTTFVWTKTTHHDPEVPEDMVFPSLVEGIAGKKLSTLMAAIREGVKIAYEKQSLPYMEAILEDISEYELGQYLQMKMMEMMYLGRLMNVNPFDQPNVEMYKTETKKILLNGKK